MIRIEIDSNGEKNDRIKDFVLNGNHDIVIKEIGTALYSIIYEFARQYRDIEYPNTDYDYMGKLKKYFTEIADLAEMNANGFDINGNDLQEDLVKGLESMYYSSRIFLNGGTKEPPETNEIFMDVRYKKPD